MVINRTHEKGTIPPSIDGSRFPKLGGSRGAGWWWPWVWEGRGGDVKWRIHGTGCGSTFSEHKICHPTLSAPAVSSSSDRRVPLPCHVFASPYPISLSATTTMTAADLNRS
ncbi:hypothetical protein BHM03_00004070 [Ensete ventricosum]|nr:hypothetical protein BHM03_00004070 [Ensete ventricosum]